MNALDLSGIHRSYSKGKEVLRGVDLAVPAGEVCGLLGTNGAGKTTLLRIAMGFLHPQSGSVRVLGLDPARQSVELKRRVGYVSEDQVLPGHLRTREVIDLHRSLYPSWDKQLERQLLSRFHVEPGARVSELSKGMARQLALVCAVAHRPELLLLDEPAGGLDPAARRGFLEVAIELLADEGSTIVFSSHHMADVERIAGRVVLLDGGKVVLDRDLDELRESTAVSLEDLFIELVGEGS